MKKRPIKELAGKIGKGLLTGITKSIPVVGDVVENITSEDGGKGNLDYRKLASQIIRLVTFGILVWQFVEGNVSLDMLLKF